MKKPSILKTEIREDQPIIVSYYYYPAFSGSYWEPPYDSEIEIQNVLTLEGIDIVESLTNEEFFKLCEEIEDQEYEKEKLISELEPDRE
jgi:hypothetical protein